MKASDQFLKSTETNYLVWLVADNHANNDYILCNVIEENIYQYQINVLKTSSNTLAEVGDIIEKKIIEYNYIGPDGFYLSIENFPSKKKANEFIYKWISQYKKQGYYSSTVYGKIPYRILHKYIDMVRVTKDIDELL